MADKKRKTRVGRVVSDKMEKTVVIAVGSTKVHPLYKKLLRRTTKFMAHDEKGEARMGDVVRIVESRPISKMKHWRVTDVLERRVQAAPVSEVASAGVDVVERKHETPPASHTAPAIEPVAEGTEAAVEEETEA